MIRRRRPRTDASPPAPPRSALAAPAARAQWGRDGLRRAGRHAAAPAPARARRKEEGPAEEAPEEAARPADLEPLGGYADQSRRRMQIFELDGYLRLRSDYMHDFFLGQGYYERLRTGVPGSRSTGCRPSRCRSSARRPHRRRSRHRQPSPPRTAATRTSAARTFASAWSPPQRDRSGARHAQFDVLDNTIMGSTPDSWPDRGQPPAPGRTRRRLRPAPPFLATTQDPPEVGRTASSPASAPSAPGPRLTPSSVPCVSAACPGTSGAASSTTTAAARTATAAPRSIG